MTKTRPPLSFELALTRVAGLIGWTAVAEILVVEERTARNWSDPDTRPTAGQSIGLDQGVALDVAYRAAGGDGAPMQQCFALQVETGLADACPGSVGLSRSIARAAREFGEAFHALVFAAAPGASDGSHELARRETEEAIDALTCTLPNLRGSRRGPEVPPPEPNGS